MTGGFAQQSAKYHGSVKQENPLRYDVTGSAPGGARGGAGRPADAVDADGSGLHGGRAGHSTPPVHPAGTAPEAQILSTEDPAAAFWSPGIPGFSVGGVQDTNSRREPLPVHDE